MLEDPEPVFSFEFSTGSRQMLFSIICIGIPLCLVLSVMAIATWQSTDWFAIAFTTFIATGCSCGFAKMAWDWKYPKRWGITLTHDSLCWFTPQKAEQLPLDSIATISVDDRGDIPRMAVATTVDKPTEIYPNCLGDLLDFCRRISEIRPDIGLKYRGPGAKKLARELGRELS